MRLYENIIIGAGQAGLSVAYYFRRYNIDYLILDQEERSGASWLHTWDGLRLFSPLEYSSLSGWQMPKTKGEYPLKSEFLDYLEQYEKKYNFPIERPVQVVSISFDKDVFEVITNKVVIFVKHWCLLPVLTIILLFLNMRITIYFKEIKCTLLIMLIISLLRAECFNNWRW